MDLYRCSGLSQELLHWYAAVALVLQSVFSVKVAVQAPPFVFLTPIIQCYLAVSLE